MHGACCAYMVDMYVSFMMFSVYIEYRRLQSSQMFNICSLGYETVLGKASDRQCFSDHQHRIPFPRPPVSDLSWLLWVQQGMTNICSGDTLRVVSTTLAMGSKTQSMKTEVIYCAFSS